MWVLLNELPPKPPSHDTLNYGRIISFPNKKLVRLLNIVRKPHVKPMRKVHLKQKIFIKIKLHYVRIFSLVQTWGVPHAENKVFFPVSANSFGYDIGLYFSVIALLFVGLFWGDQGTEVVAWEGGGCFGGCHEGGWADSLHFLWAKVLKGVLCAWIEMTGGSGWVIGHLIKSSE